MDEASHSRLDRLLAQTSEQAFPGVPRRVVIYGAGHVGREMAALLLARGCEVTGFLDRAARPGETRDGLPVLAPDSLEGRTAVDRAEATVLGVFNPYANPAQIRGLLQGLGAKCVLPAIPLLAEVPAHGAHFWLGPRSVYLDHADDMHRCLDLWGDASSRRAFLDRIALGLDGSVDLMASPDLEHQYFPEDIPRWGSPVRMVDCGAYDGDTYRQLEGAGYTFAAWAAFEPDTANFAALQAFMAGEAGRLDHAIALPYGVWSRREELLFASGQGTSSSVDGGGDLVISCVALDDMDLPFLPNLIKMDIEGAEEEALLGAQRTISRNRPGLAISAYHRPTHLWKLAKLLDAWALDYEFFLRSHAYNGFELVLYAIPKSAG